MVCRRDRQRGWCSRETKMEGRVREANPRQTVMRVGWRRGEDLWNEWEGLWGGGVSKSREVVLTGVHIPADQK